MKRKVSHYFCPTNFLAKILLFSSYSIFFCIFAFAWTVVIKK